MDKYIYKVTNRINGKVYIGQTNNVKRRIQEHKHDRRAGHLLHLAIKKYGLENFDVEILYFGSDYNEQERYFVKKFNSQNPKYGYNIMPGGQDSSGEDNPMAILTLQLAKCIQNDLMFTEKTFDTIAEEHGIPIYFVNHINYGESFADINLAYPLRKSKRLSSETVANIIKDLKDNVLSIEEIALKYHIKRYIVTGINKGTTHKKKDICYPIRELGLKEKLRKDIIDALRNTELSGKDIAKRFKVSLGIVYRINDGSTWHDDNITYPIRKLKSIITCNECD